jgi:integrase
VQQRIGSVIDWAFARDYRATQVSKKAVQIGLGSQTDRPKHFAALPYSAVPAFLDKIRGEAATNSRAALEFLILTAARSNEVRSATFAEVDLEAAEWRIPAERMKAKREHVVPLSPSAVAIVAARKENATGALIFPGNKATALSDVALTKALRVAGVSAEMGTVHGFRSGFRDWVSEETNFPGDVAEAALAHTISNKTEAAYRRGKLLAKRREMMLAWESFLNRRSAEVVPLRQAVS